MDIQDWELFLLYEKRPPECLAVLVDEDNVDRLAHYLSLQYETMVERRGGHTYLTLGDGKDFGLVVPMGHVLVQDRPPWMMPLQDFHAQWRATTAPK